MKILASTILALFLGVPAASGGGVELGSGNYFMDLGSGHIINLETGDCYVNIGGQVPPGKTMAANPGITENPPAQSGTGEELNPENGNYYMQVDGRMIRNLQNGDYYMKLE